MIGKALILSWAVGAGLQAQPEAGHGMTDNPIYQACRQVGGDAASCSCIERESRSRFNLSQRHVIAAAMPELSDVGEPQDLVDALGLSLDQILNLRQRVMYADPVFRQACGIGLNGE